MRRWGLIWRVLIRPALTCFTAPPRLHLVNKELGSNIFWGMSTKRSTWCSEANYLKQNARNHPCFCSSDSQKMDEGKYNPFLTNRGGNSLPITIVLGGNNAIKHSASRLTQDCKEVVKAASIDVYECVPSGCSFARLIIRSMMKDRRRLLMLIGVFDFYYIKVFIDTCRSHGNGT